MGLTNRSKRNSAVRRGLESIYRSACKPEHFESYGHDYLCCFYCISATSRDSELRRTARHLGRERAREWRRKHARIADTVDANEVANLILGSDAADRLGIRDKSFKTQLRKAAGNFTALDYFSFDPAREPPPNDVPEDCDCGTDNPRGQKICKLCGSELSKNSTYWIWLNALTLSYTAQRSSVCIGTPFKDVLQWLPAMRNYPEYGDEENLDFYWAVYAVTHVVYTLNDYSAYRLSPTWLPNEYEFLQRNLGRAAAAEDPEMMGEFLDTLKSFGLSDAHPLIERGRYYLLSEQNVDGSWGEPDAEDVYESYHPTWTAIDGLRDYSWRGQRLSLQGLVPLVKSFADNRCESSTFYPEHKKT